MTVLPLCSFIVVRFDLCKTLISVKLLIMTVFSQKMSFSRKILKHRTKDCSL